MKGPPPPYTPYPENSFFVANPTTAHSAVLSAHAQSDTQTCPLSPIRTANLNDPSNPESPISPYHPRPRSQASTHRAAPPTPSRGPATLTTLPLSLLHRVVELTLDPRATPSKFDSDGMEERIRRVWGLFRGLRGVDRRFYLASTSLLRNIYLPAWHAALQPNFSSDPLPPGFRPDSSNDSGESPTQPVFLERGRETAVYDRFIAVRVGEDLRRVESELSEGSEEAERDIFVRLQPGARIEDLLLTLPYDLVIPSSSESVASLQFPLPQGHLSITATPAWAQLYLSSVPVGWPHGEKFRRGRELLLEVRRERGLDDTVHAIGEGLRGVQRGTVRWGERLG